MSGKILKRYRLLKYTASQFKTDRGPLSKIITKELLVVQKERQEYGLTYTGAKA